MHLFLVWFIIILLDISTFFLDCFRSPRILVSHSFERERKMSKAGALDLASGLGGKIDKSDVLSAVDKYPSSLYARFFCECVYLYVSERGNNAVFET